MNKLFITLVVAMLGQACAIHADLQPASSAIDVVTDISDLRDIAKGKGDRFIFQPHPIDWG